MDNSILGPVRVGDRFLAPGKGGEVWRVIETKPGGRVELFEPTRARFISTYKRQLAFGWVRIEKEAADD